MYLRFMNWVWHGSSMMFETKSSYYCVARRGLLHGSSTTWFQMSCYCRAKVAFNSLNWVQHGNVWNRPELSLISQFTASPWPFKYILKIKNWHRDAVYKYIWHHLIKSAVSDAVESLHKQFFNETLLLTQLLPVLCVTCIVVVGFD